MLLVTNILWHDIYASFTAPALLIRVILLLRPLSLGIRLLLGVAGYRGPFYVSARPFPNSSCMATHLGQS